MAVEKKKKNKLSTAVVDSTRQISSTTLGPKNKNKTQKTIGAKHPKNQKNSFKKQKNSTTKKQKGFAKNLSKKTTKKMIGINKTTKKLMANSKTTRNFVEEKAPPLQFHDATTMALKVGFHF